MVQRKSFDDLAARLADHQAVDWDDAQRSASSDEERAWIRNLHVIGDVARLARSEDPDAWVDQALAGRTMAEPAPRVAASLADEESKGEVWGPLQLLEKVGSGSFGDVYRAWDPVLNRQVALKLLNSRALELPGAAQRVLEEARLLARVEHPNVARIYGVEEHAGRLGIWMEFVEGADLASVLLERGTLSLEEALRLGVELCSAVQAVHEANVVHKDIKPHNVMLRRDGRLVLMDFGAGRGRAFREGDREIAITGTPRYMAPETFRREMATPQSDVYSIGVLLDHCVSGTFPVDGTIPEILQAHEAGRRTPLRERCPDLPEAFLRLIERATDPDRTGRFASAAEMGSALEALRVRSTVRSRWTRRRVLGTSLAVAAAATFAALGLRSWMVPAGPLEVNVVFSGTDNGQFVRFESGDAIDPNTRLSLTIQPNRDAYVYVLNRDSEGNTVVLWPMDGGDREPLRGGRAHEIPGEVAGDQKSWRFSAVEGPERFLVIASTEPLPEFERSLQEVAALSVDGGLKVTPVGAVQLAALGRDAIPGESTRGVVGLADAPETGPDVFAIAEKFAEGEAAGTEMVQLYHLRLMNLGE